jgi:hypothetical protein
MQRSVFPLKNTMLLCQTRLVDVQAFILLNSDMLRRFENFSQLDNLYLKADYPELSAKFD